MSERTRYHHGGLRDALLLAGLELTRSGGAGALSVREATRRAGVSPNAAYRHFADRQALLDAVAAEILEKVAAGMRPVSSGSATAALRAVGLGYITFARREPGWFSVAFFDFRAGASGVAMPPPSAPPFTALSAALDSMVAEGVISVERRIGAEWPCWAAVHGFAGLVLRGPLRGLADAQVDLLAERTVDDIIAGLVHGRSGV